MDFSQALEQLKLGRPVKRSSWNPLVKVEAQFPDEHSKMGAPYLYYTDVNGKNIPWIPSQFDLFSEDWRLFVVLVKATEPTRLPDSIE